MSSTSDRRLPRPRAPLPEWLKVKWGKKRLSEETRRTLRDAGLNTVCQSAMCPNIGECFGAGTATFLLMGDRCTRDCRFCAVPHGQPAALDHDEPRRIAEAADRMGLRYVVLTSVTRDDLPDGGASHFARAIQAIKTRRPGSRVEVLVPDFQGDARSLESVLRGRPDVLNHNIETVRRLQSQIRPQASYEVSTGVLVQARQLAPDIPTKSGLMVGLGETDDEVVDALRDLAEAGVRIVTIGQYLQPSSKHLPVQRYVHPDTFPHYEQAGRALGLSEVIAGPFIRSSYHAESAAASIGL